MVFLSYDVYIDLSFFILKLFLPSFHIYDTPSRSSSSLPWFFLVEPSNVDQPMNTKDLLHVPNWSITRSKAKALKEALNGLVMQVLAKAKLGNPLEYYEKVLVHLIYMQEGPNPSLFGPWSFNNKATNIISVSTNLVLWCFYMRGFLTSFGFPIMYEKFNYFI